MNSHPASQSEAYICRRTRMVAVATALQFLLCLQMAAAAEPHEFDRTVTVTKARSLCFANTVQVTGVLVPRKEILVRPDREGMQITQVLAQVGDTVRSGQVLLRLSPSEGMPGGNVDVTAPSAGMITFSSAVV